MSSNNLWHLKRGRSPIVATAIHHGHKLRQEVAQLMKLDEATRLREEDPFTGEWTSVSDNSIVVQSSRFQVDLNRKREKAVYVKPEDAWGLRVWTQAPSPELVSRSLAEYDAFYSDLRKLFKDLEDRFGHFVVFDLHSYNHMRDGANGAPADPSKNPEVNIGTGSLARKAWAPLVDRFIADLSAFDFLGRRLDVRENVKFSGANLAGWTHQNFPDSACVLAIEFKKFFMDEWTGKPDDKQVRSIGQTLKSAVPGVLEELNRK
jgi:N-formylglutamate deformylase